jgi:hypothetical protein
VTQPPKATGVLNMYTGFKLDSASQQMLKDRFGYEHQPMGHHVTHEFKPERIEIQREARVQVITKLVSYNVEVLVVDVDGNSKRPDGSFYHLTWSLNKEFGAKPYDSNVLVKHWAEDNANEQKYYKSEWVFHENIHMFLEGRTFDV